MHEASIRLSKRLVELGLCSRRETDEFIELGLVSVDGQVVNTLGARVSPQQRVELRREALPEQPERMTLIVHKPARLDPAAVLRLLGAASRSPHDASAYRFMAKHLKQLLEAGYLDDEAGGLLVLTQERGLAHKLLREARDYEQEYLVWLGRPADDEALARLNALRELGGQPLRPFKASRQGDRQLRIVLRENRDGLVRGLCQAAGLQVERIKRNRLGRIGLVGLDEGQWRYLREGERF